MGADGDSCNGGQVHEKRRDDEQMKKPKLLSEVKSEISEIQLCQGLYFFIFFLFFFF